jgi:hypothetical protein
MKSTVAREISKTIRVSVQMTLNIIYFPQLGYLITLSSCDGQNVEQIERDFLFEFQFRTESTLFFKNPRMRGKNQYKKRT